MTIVSNIDLHCHTTASDGSLSPSDMVERAYNRGLNVLAITDHDLVAGVEEAEQAAFQGNALLLANDEQAPQENFIKSNAEILKVINGTLKRSAAERTLTILPGVEFSTTWNNEQIHIVGLFIDIHHPRLLQLIQNRKVARTERALAISAKLERLGFAQPYERCAQLAQEGANITRGNFARLIYADGKANSVDDAFNQYLRCGKPAYVQTTWGAIDEVVEVVKEAGGIAILAHPRRYHISNQRLRRLISEFKNWGGEAMEVSSAQQKPLDREYLTSLCKQYGLLASLGSDFHSEGVFRDLGQNLDLPENLTPVWTCEAAARFGLNADFKQRLVSLTYSKDADDSRGAEEVATIAATTSAAMVESKPGSVTIVVNKDN